MDISSPISNTGLFPYHGYLGGGSHPDMIAKTFFTP